MMIAVAFMCHECFPGTAFYSSWGSACVQELYMNIATSLNFLKYW